MNEANSGALGATAIETNVAAQLRARAAAVVAFDPTQAAQLNTWASQLESDPVGFSPPYPQPYYPPQPQPYFPPFRSTFPYYTFFHPIDSFFPVFGGRVRVRTTEG